MEQLKDKHIKDIISYSVKKMPFQDFEDELMERIAKEQIKRNSVFKDLKRSWIFFICGLISGVLILIVPLIIKDIQINQTLQSYTGAGVIIIICFILLLFSEKLIKVTFYNNR